jgi:hypothetical protein
LRPAGHGTGTDGGTGTNDEDPWFSITVNFVPHTAFCQPLACARSPYQALMAALSRTLR